jgi:hypothetical protein
VRESADLLLNLRIVQQPQKHLFERLVLLRCLNLVIEFGSVIHRAIIPKARQRSAPYPMATYTGIASRSGGRFAVVFNADRLWFCIGSRNWPDWPTLFAVLSSPAQPIVIPLAGSHRFSIGAQPALNQTNLRGFREPGSFESRDVDKYVLYSAIPSYEAEVVLDIEPFTLPVSSTDTLEGSPFDVADEVLRAAASDCD